MATKLTRLRLYPVNPTHTHPKGLYRAEEGNQQFMLMHFSNGNIAITPERLDEIIEIAELHEVLVEVQAEPMPAPRKEGPV